MELRLVLTIVAILLVFSMVMGFHFGIYKGLVADPPTIPVKSSSEAYNIFMWIQAVLVIGLLVSSIDLQKLSSASVAPYNATGGARRRR